MGLGREQEVELCKPPIFDPGEKVVSDGADKLKDGATVIPTIAPDSPSGLPSDAPAAPDAAPKRRHRQNPDGSPANPNWKKQQ